MKPRWEVIAGLVKEHGLRVGAEIGVAEGRFSSALLKLCPDLTLYGVDPYLPEYKTWDGGSWDETRQAQNCIKARVIAKRFKNRFSLIEAPSTDAARGFDDGSLDFVFIDADHSYEAVMSDIAAWLPKVRPGGWITGHDYNSVLFPGVVSAVKENFAKFSTDQDHVWIAQVQEQPFHQVLFEQRLNVTAEHICGNIRQNAGRDLPLLQFKRICICASGASLKDHLDDIRARWDAGFDIAAMNGSHNFLIENGIIPDFMFMIDSREGKNLPFLRLANDHTTYIIASQCHSEIFDALKGRKILLWQVHNYEGADIAIKEAMGERQAPIFTGAYNVGQSCLGPVFAMGYRVWHLFGYDASAPGGQKHSFAQPQNADDELHEMVWPLDQDRKPIPGVTKHYLVSGTMAHHAQTFVDRYNIFRDAGIEIEIIGDGLLPDMVRFLGRKGKLMHGPKEAIERELAPPPVPAPLPRKRIVERLPIVSFKWRGHIPYFAEDVNIWARMVDRHLARDHELVCVTDDAEGIDGGIRTIPLWRDHFEHGRDWHRLKLFAEEMADLIGPRFVVMDLDTVICGQLDPLFDNDAPFKAWADPNRPSQYCTALFMMDAGAFPHVYYGFNAKLAMELRTSGQFLGYDQAWVSYVLSGQPKWTAADGVESFRVDILKGADIENAPESAKLLSPTAVMVNFHGRYNPRDEAVRERFPWVSEYHR